MQDPLRIAVVAHLRHPIAEPYMGGMEAHCALLVRALIAAGHDVTLFASGDSAPDLPLHPIAAEAYEATLPWALWHGRRELSDWLDTAYANAWRAIRDGAFDVVHNNSLSAPIHDWAARDGVPMVTSLHVPPFARLRDAVAANPAPWMRLTVTSESQLPLWDGAADGRIAVAHNGIDLDRFRVGTDRHARALWCGRITPTKGTREALVAATAAGIALDLAGPVDCGTYFDEVSPLIASGHRYLGHLSGEALAQRMGQAAMLVCTPCWDEPFGLVAAEALACGTPVVAFDRGALREVVGDCGAVVASVADLAAAMRSVAGRVSPLACRARAEAMFGAPAMIARYAESYAAAIAGARASSTAMTRAVLA